MSTFNASGLLKASAVARESQEQLQRACDEMHAVLVAMVITSGNAPEGIEAAIGFKMTCDGMVNSITTVIETAERTANKVIAKNN